MPPTHARGLRISWYAPDGAFGSPGHAPPGGAARELALGDFDSAATNPGRSRLGAAPVRQAAGRDGSRGLDEVVAGRPPEGPPSPHRRPNRLGDRQRGVVRASGNRWVTPPFDGTKLELAQRNHIVHLMVPKVRLRRPGSRPYEAAPRTVSSRAQIKRQLDLVLVSGRGTSRTARSTRERAPGAAHQSGAHCESMLSADAPYIQSESFYVRPTRRLSTPQAPHASRPAALSGAP